MRPTKYNKRITIQKPTKTGNEIGGWINNYNTLEWSYTCWASVVVMNGYKKLQYGMNANEEVFEVEMRKRLVNIDVDCRIVYAGNNYQVVSTPVITDDKVNFQMSRTI